MAPHLRSRTFTIFVASTFSLNICCLFCVNMNFLIVALNVITEKIANFLAMQLLDQLQLGKSMQFYCHVVSVNNHVGNITIKSNGKVNIVYSFSLSQKHFFQTPYIKLLNNFIIAANITNIFYIELLLSGVICSAL